MKLLVIDGNSLIHRAFHALPPMNSSKGVPTNAIKGFMNIYMREVADIKPDCVAVAFDVNHNTFRHEAVATYKANRSEMPDELFTQLEIIKKIIDNFGIKRVELEGFEADDMLGTLSKACEDTGNKCVLLTGDRDSFQLISENTTVKYLTTKKTPDGKGTIEYTVEKFKEEYGFEPINLIDFKALCGDSSDNIKGVAGVGKKTAETLIREYATIEKIYSELETGDIKKAVKTKLENGKADAEESKWLATIKRDCQIDTDIEHYKIQPLNNDELYRIISDLEMYDLRNRMKLVPPAKNEKAEETETFPLTEKVIAGTEEAFIIVSNEKIWFATDGKVYFSEDGDLIKKALSSDCKKITDNAKPLYHMAELKNVIFDLNVAGYLLNSDMPDYSVKSMCIANRLQYTDDITMLKELYPIVLEQITRAGMRNLLFEIEMPFTEVLAEMEKNGIAIDTEGVKKFGEKLDREMKEIEEGIYLMAGKRFNILSPKQVGEVLFEDMNISAKKKTKTGYSTSADVLEEIKDDYPITEAILEYRKYSKLKSTYVEGLLSKVQPDGRIHTLFKQTETRTGRISSAEPNMQNIPVRTELGREMRKFFVAGQGNTLIDADYSQIELRILAGLSRDENMIKAFEDGADIHAITASQIMGVKPEQVTKEMRSNAKAVNFGIVYGIGAFSLAKDTGITKEQASRYIENYFRQYPKVKDFMEKTVEQAEKYGFVSTLFHRRRYIHEIRSSNQKIKAEGKRMAMNAPIQGTSADIIKIAMVKIYRRLKAENLKAFLILQVHDEIIAEAEESIAERVAEIIEEEMEKAVDFGVKLTAEAGTGESWYNAKG